VQADIDAGAVGSQSRAPHSGGRRHPSHRPRIQDLRLWAIVGLLLVCVLWLVATPTTSSAATSGVATIIQPNTGAPLASGGSGTAYGVSLPSGASCPGDTAHQGYHVYSYLIPAGHTPTEVSYKGEFPSRWYGYISYGAYFGAVNTAEGTGQVMTLPQFSWMRYSSYLGELFPHGSTKATWEGGIVCATAGGKVTNYWNTQIIFTRTSADPGGFTWRVVAPPPANSNNTWLVVGVTLLVLAVLFGALAVVLSRRRGRTEPPAGDGPESASPPVGPGAARRLPTPAGR
jgi:hypothetical protein